MSDPSDLSGEDLFDDDQIKDEYTNEDEDKKVDEIYNLIINEDDDYIKEESAIKEDDNNNQDQQDKEINQSTDQSNNPYNPIRSKKQAIKFRCTEEILGSGIIKRVIAHWKFGIEIYKICRRINPKQRKGNAISSIDVYAIIKMAIKNGLAKQRQSPSKEISVNEFSKVYDLWMEGYSSKAIIKKLSIKPLKQQQLTNVVKALNQRYKELTLPDLKDHKTISSMQAVTLFRKKISELPDNSIIKFGRIARLGPQKKEYFIAKISKLPVDLQKVIEQKVIEQKVIEQKVIEKHKERSLEKGTS